MDKNKSIDGLASRAEKTVGVSARATKKTSNSTKKSSPATQKTQKITITEPMQPAKPTTDKTIDFLDPVQAFDLDGATGTLTKTKKSTTKKASTLMDQSPKSKKSKTSPQSAKKPRSKTFKIVTSIIIVLLLLLITCGVAFILWGNDIIAKITGGQGNVFDLLTFVDDTYEPLKTDANGRTNILAFGTSGYDMAGTEGDGKHDGSQLTDSIMVISLDQNTGDIAMLSLPRDLKASPTCTATGKINEVYWCNNQHQDNEQAGATALMTEVGNVLGIDFQYYAHLNWGSLVKIVDALGGITVNLDENIRSDYEYFEAGKDYVIDGTLALDLARARHGTAQGDFSRSNSQQKILIGIKNRIFEKNLSIADLVSLANTLGDDLRTNFSVSEIKTLAHLTSDFDFDSMRQVSLIEPVRYVTTGTINGISYVLPSSGVGNYTNIRNYVAKMFSSDPRDYEETSILILNGTEEAGLAAAEQVTLIDDGFTNIYTDNAPDGEYNHKYTLYAADDENPGTKKLLEKQYHVTAKSFSELPDGVDQSYDFILILGQK